MNQGSMIVRAVWLNDQGLSLGGIAQVLVTDRDTVRELLNEAPDQWIREPETLPLYREAS